MKLVQQQIDSPLTSINTVNSNGKKNLVYIPDITLYKANITGYKEIKVNEWKPHTTLIAGDSLLNGIQEGRIKRNTKVRVFPGATIEDMYYYITPLLKRKPENIILHIGTNNCTSDEASAVTSKIINLVNYIASILPRCNVILSSIVVRTDNNKARITGEIVNSNLLKLGLKVILHKNVTESHLGRKGLHLVPTGIGKLAINFIKFLKGL